MGSTPSTQPAINKPEHINVVSYDNLDPNINVHYESTGKHMANE